MKRFEPYFLNGNSEEKRICLYWLTSFGIQSVVHLKPSEFLLSTVERHIKGEWTLDRVKKEIDQYYSHHHHHSHDESDHRHHTQEADRVSYRIVKYFMSDDFSLSFDGFSDAHHQLFHGIYAHSGQIREHSASKKEWVLGNTSVIYPAASGIREYMDYLFETESRFNYEALKETHKLRHFCEFIAKLFIANAFQYANSRVAFVYAMKYMLSRGYSFRNDTFLREAWYFRNATIRASYANMHQGIYPTTDYMEMFLGNLFLDEDNELRNHRMVIKGE